MRIAAVQMSITDGDLPANMDEAAGMIDRAVEQGAEVVCLPEMWPTGFDYAGLLKEAQAVPGPLTDFLSRKAADHGIFLVGGSIPEREGNCVYNTAVAFNREGRLTAAYRKIHLFTLMNEQEYLAGGDRLSTFDLDGITAGLFICYDIRFPELTRALTAAGAKILFHPAEFPHPRLHHWRTLIQARAIENQAWIVSANRAGVGSGGNHFFGHSLIVDPWGEVVAEGDEEPGIVLADIDLSKADTVRSTLTALGDIRHDLFSLGLHQNKV